MSKQKVLSLYKQILRIGQSWKSEVSEQTVIERNYIINEARRLFRENMKLENHTEIQESIREAEARLEIALHYKNPYPRPVNLPTYSLSPSHSKGLRTQEKFLRRSRPVYLKSLDKEMDKKE